MTEIPTAICGVLLCAATALAKAEAQRTIKIPLSDREKAIVERLGEAHK